MKAKSFKFLLFFLTVGFLSWTLPVKSSTVQWIGQDTIFLDEYNVTVSRPDDRWRVIETNWPQLIEMRYQQSGRNVSIFVRELEQIKVDKKFTREERRKKISRILENLLKPYTEMGFVFYESHKSEDLIFAAATNIQREILLLQIQLNKHEGKVTPFALEMTIPRELYHEFENTFFETAKSFIVKE